MFSSLNLSKDDKNRKYETSDSYVCWRDSVEFLSKHSFSKTALRDSPVLLAY